MNFTITKLPYMLGSTWLVIAGALFMRLAGRVTEQPGVVAPEGAYKTGQGVPKY